MKNPRVTDIIGNRYKVWKHGDHIFLNCATGSGKTYFILKVLGEWAKLNDKKILYLCNRKELKKQIIKTSKKFGTYQFIEIYTYQYLQTYDIYDMREILEYDYIVFDEAHYIISEGWNLYTDVIDSIIDIFHMCATMIFMSGTSKDIFDFLDKKKLIKKHNIFTIKYDYSYVDKLIFYEDDDYVMNLIESLDENEKLIYICSNKERGFTLKQKFNDKAHFVCSKYDIRYPSESPIEVILDGKLVTFKKQVLIATSVLDVGIDIYDKSIKHIVTDLYDMITLQQALGRKRLVDEDDRCTFHIKNISKKTLAGMLNLLLEEVRVADLYLNDKDGFIEYMEDKGRHINLNRCFYDKIDCRRQIISKEFNYMYYWYLKYRIEELHTAKEVGFDFLVILALGYSITDKRIEYVEEIENEKRKYNLNLDIEEYLNSLVGKRLYKEDKKKIIDKIGLVDSRGRIQKSLKLLNSYLSENNIRFIIESKKSNRLRYWCVKDRF